MLAPYFFIKQGYRFPQWISVPYFFCQRSRWATQERRLNCSRVVSPLRFEALRGVVNGFYKGLLNLVHLQCP